jgi:hypothetical protein
MFRWQVSGVKGVYFFSEGQNWQEHGVVGGGERKACPPQTTTYCLRVVKQDDSVENHYIRVLVRG